MLCKTIATHVLKFGGLHKQVGATLTRAMINNLYPTSGEHRRRYLQHFFINVSLSFLWSP